MGIVQSLVNIVTETVSTLMITLALEYLEKENINPIKPIYNNSYKSQKHLYVIAYSLVNSLALLKRLSLKT